MKNTVPIIAALLNGNPTTYHLNFDGVNDNIIIPASSDINNLPLNDFTLEFSGAINQTGNYFLLDKSSSSEGFQIYTFGGDLYLYFSADSWTYYYGAYFAVPSGTHHYEFDWDAGSTQLKVFIDGVEESLTLDDGSFGSGTYDDESTFDMALAAELDNQYNLNCMIRWFIISNVVKHTSNFTPPSLTVCPKADANTVLRLALDKGSGTTAYDSSSNANNGTITGATWVLDSIVPPTVSITSSESIVTKLSTVPITITFSKEVMGFTSSNLTLDNTVFTAVSNFTTSDNIVWTADITVSDTGEGTIDISAGVCTDLNWNSNIAADQFSIYTAEILLHDEFTTTESAPITSPRTCEPGPGTWPTVVDTTNVMSITNGTLKFSGRSATGDPGLWGPLQTEVAGLAFYTKINAEPNLASYIAPGWDNDTAGASAHRFYVRPQVQTLAVYIGGSDTSDFTTFARATYHEFLFVQRGSSNGILGLAKPNGGSWILIFPGLLNTASSLYPSIKIPSYSGGDLYVDTATVLNLPATFTSANGLMTHSLSGSRSQGDGFAHEADCHIRFTCTTLPASGQHEIRFRQRDESNYWKVTIDSSGNLDLDEVVAGTPTQRGTSAGIIASGNKITITAVGNNIQVKSGTYGNVTRITYSSASNFNTKVSGSLLTLGASGVISDFETWPYYLSGTPLNILDSLFT